MLQKPNKPQGDFAESHLSERSFLGSFAKYMRKHLVQMQMRFPMTAMVNTALQLASSLTQVVDCQVKLTLNTAKE